MTGGAQHDWLLRGNADFDQSATTPLPVTALDCSLLGPGRELVPYINEGGASVVPVGAENANVKVEEGQETQYNVYGLIRDLRRVTTDGDFTATLAFADDGPPLTVTVLGAPGSEYFLATAPSLRRAEEDSAKLEDFRQPVLIARRTGEAPLTSRRPACLAGERGPGGARCLWRRGCGRGGAPRRVPRPDHRPRRRARRAAER